jgi:5-methylcytosine-specific restriction endonuclease McrA
MDAPRRIGVPGWSKGLHVEHVIALANGGLHSLDNCRPAHGICNVRKGRN